jgi:hypothetical protein
LYPIPKYVKIIVNINNNINMAEVPSQYSDMNDSLNNDESIVLG